LRSALGESLDIFPTEAPAAIHLDSVNLTTRDVTHKCTPTHTKVILDPFGRS